MKKVIILFFVVTCLNALFSQTNPQNFSIPDSLIKNDKTQFGSFDKSIFEEKISLQTELQTQKLFKIIFLSGFIFMTLLVVVLMYINNIKIKQVLSMINEQEKNFRQQQIQVEKFSIILNNTIDGIAIVDINNTILWANKSFGEIYGYNSEDLTNKPIDFFSSDERDIDNLIKKATQENKPVQFTISTKNKLGAELFIQRRIIPLNFEGDTKSFAIIDTDFTALKLVSIKN